MEVTVFNYHNFYVVVILCNDDKNCVMNIKFLVLQRTVQ